MAKVLRCKKNSNKIFRITGAEYHYFSGNDMLILNDKHAEELMKRYPEELFEVSESEWSETHKSKYSEFKTEQKKIAMELYPDAFQEDTELSEEIETKKKKRK